MTTPVLRQELSALQLFTLGFGCIIGVGWIMLVGAWLASAGSLGAIVAFAIGGAGMLLIGLCYCTAYAQFPVAGGEVAYCYGYFGLRAAFIAGWILVLTFAIGCAFEAISVGWILAEIAPSLSGPVLYTVWGGEVHAGRLAIGLTLMLLIAVTTWLGVRATARLQDLITWGLVAVTAVCMGAALWYGDPANLEPLFADGSRRAGAGLLSVLAMVPMFFLGFNVIPQAIGEKAARVGTRQVAAAIVVSLLAAMLFYMLVILMTAIAVPRGQLLGQQLPAYTAISAALGSTTAGKIVLVAGLLGVLSTWNAIFYASTRTLLVLARIGTIPAGLAAIDPRFQTPLPAIAVTAAIGALGTLLGPAALVPMVNGLGMAMTLVFAMIAAGILRAGREPPASAVPRGVGRPRLIAAMALLMALALLLNGLTQAWAASTIRPPPEWLLLVLWGLLGAVLWVAAARWRRAVPDADRRRLLHPEPDRQ